MTTAHLKHFFFLASLVFSSLSHADSLWVGETSGDGILTNSSNWDPSTVPTGAIANFNADLSQINLSPRILGTNLSVSSFNFLNSADLFNFTLNGPFNLTFTGIGITGANTNANIQAVNDSMGMEIPQLIFSGAPSITTSIGNSILNATNSSSGTLFSTELGNDLAQILFDGSGGLGTSGIGTFIVGGTAKLNALNDSLISINNGFNDVAQIIFDGSGGGSYTNPGSGHIESTINGNASIQLTNNNTISNTNYLNDVAQLIFDGSGGFSSSYGGTGHSTILIDQEARIVALNSSFISGGYVANDTGQILFDGSGGESDGAPGIGYSNATLSGSTLLSATNTGTLENADNGNDLAQILFDGSGGINVSGPGTGHSIVAIQNTASILAMNTGTISSDGEATSNTGQIIFDGSSGLDRGYAANGSSTVTIGDSAYVSAMNQGSILHSGAVHAVAQIIFDGHALSYVGSTGSSSLTLETGATLSATNESGGVVNGDQIAFYDTQITGSGTIQATNLAASDHVTHGIAFYGATSSADDVNLVLQGSSLWIDPAHSSLFSVGSITGDSGSQITLAQPLAISPAEGINASYKGSVSASSGADSVTIGGTGVQVFGGVLSMPDTAFNLNAGATLKGTGTVGTVLIGDSASIAPGNSVGTLQTLSLTFDSGSTFQVEIDPTTASLLDVTGSASLNGAVFIVQDEGLYERSGERLILETTAGLSGAFSSIVTGGLSIGGLPGYTFSLSPVGNDLYLSYQSEIPLTYLSGNSRKIAKTINEFGEGKIISYFNGTSKESLQSALESVSPARNVFGAYITQQTAFGLSTLLSDHLDILRVFSSRFTGSEIALLADASDSIPPQKRTPEYSVWVSGFGEYAHQSAISQNPSFHFLSGAVLVGIDHLMKDQASAGGSIGYANTHFYESGHAGHGNINYYFGSVYGNIFAGAFYLSPALWGFYNHNQNVRNIQTGEISQQAKASITAWQLLPHLEAGLYVDSEEKSFTPFTSVDWAISFQQEYRESGASPFNAKQGGKISSMIRSETGAKLTQGWKTSWGRLFTREKLSYIYEGPFGTKTMTASFVGTPSSFTLTALNQTLNLCGLAFDFGAMIGKKNPATLQFGYVGEIGSNYWSNQIQFTFKMDF